MPNAFAYLMLGIWPVVIWVLFQRLPASRALVWSLVGAYLVLPPYPVAFDPPLMPALNKFSLPNLAVLAICLFVVKPRPSLVPKSTAARVLALIFVFSPIVTVLNNTEPLIFAQNSVRGLVPMDYAGIFLNHIMTLAALLAGRSLLATEDGHRDMLQIFVLAGLLFSLPVLIEVRMSPQLNTWIYGFFQHVFSQTMRAGGFRPTVFLEHGIWVAFFVMTAFLFALGLWKADRSPIRGRTLMVALYLFVILVLCKTLASLIYASLAAAAIVLVSNRVQVRIAALLAALALAYPLMKGADLIPERAMLERAAAVSDQRAQSLAFRFANENELLERARQKQVFGWGIWGRNQEHDTFTGQIESVTDGRWIITLGMYGWVGFLAEFGLLSLPIFLIWRETGLLRRQREKLFQPKSEGWARFQPSPYTGTMTLVLAINIVDLLPNATLTPLTWLVAGALLGHGEQLGNWRKELSRQSEEQLTRKRTVM